MSNSLKNARKIVDELLQGESSGRAIESEVAIDSLITALEEAFPSIFGAPSYELDFPTLINRLIKAKQLKPSCQELADRIQVLLDLGDYPNRLNNADADDLKRSLSKMAGHLKEFLEK